MQMTVPEAWALIPVPSRVPGLSKAEVTIAESSGSKGCAKETWPTIPPSKNVQGRIPRVQSMTWSATRKSRGLTSSLRDPTALKPMQQRTPSFRKAATLARLLTSWGAISWWRPWRERKATVMGFAGRDVEDEDWVVCGGSAIWMMPSDEVAGRLVNFSGV